MSRDQLMTAANLRMVAVSWIQVVGASCWSQDAVVTTCSYTNFLYTVGKLCVEN